MSPEEKLKQKLSHTIDRPGVQPHTGKDRDQTKVEARITEGKVLDLKKAGASLSQIGQHLGLHPSRVNKLLQRALRRLVYQQSAIAEDVRLLELERLDELWFRNWQLFRNLDTKMPPPPPSNDGVIDPELQAAYEKSLDGVVGRMSEASSILLRISERRANLVGINRAPMPPMAPVPRVSVKRSDIPVIRGASEEQLAELERIAMEIQNSTQKRIEVLEDGKSGDPI